MACTCVILWMLVAQENPFETNKYDYIAMFFVLLGVALVFVGKAYVGALCLIEGFLTCCSMYQLRFGWSIPTVGAYAGTWVSLLFLVIEAYRRKTNVKEKEWILRLGSRFIVRVPAFYEHENVEKRLFVLRTICIIFTASIMLFMFPVHEFLSGFSGSYMNQQKDNLPLYFFLPLVMLVCVWGGTALGYLSAGVVAVLLYDAICEVSSKGTRLFLFDSIEQHGSIGETLTARMNGCIPFIECLILLCFVLCLITAVCFARRKYGRTQETADN